MNKIMNNITKQLNEELSHVLDQIVVMIGDKTNFNQVFGADGFIARYPTLFTSGIPLCQLKDTHYYIVVDEKIVHDCAFFTEDEVKYHFFKAPFPTSASLSLDSTSCTNEMD